MRHLQLQHQSGHGEQHQRMQRNEGEQQDLTSLAISQANEGHTNHEGVAEDTGQRQH